MKPRYRSMRDRNRGIANGNGGAPGSLCGLSICLVCLVLFWGCRGGLQKRAEVLGGDRVSRIASVAERADLDTIFAVLQPTLRAPDGALPKGRGVRYVEEGNRYWAVVAGSESTEGPPPEIWIFRRDWSAIGRVRGIPLRQDELREQVAVRWDASGTRLAILFGRRGRTSAVLGLVQPPSLDFRAVLRFQDSEWHHMAWANGVLVVASIAGDENVILKVDPNTGKRTRLYVEDRSVRGRTTIGDISASPDGRWLVFHRQEIEPVPPHGYGLFLLNLASGECVQLTSEEGTDYYYHMVVRWVDSDSILFARNDGAGRWDLYRADLRLAESER